MDAIGERIKKARQAKGLSQEELAQIINSTKSAISRYESGKRQPRLDQLHRIAVVLQVSDDYLLSGEAQVSQTHLANGVHIYKDTFPFKVIEPFLDNPLSDSCDILYQDEYLIIAVEKKSTATQEELEKILDVFAPFREQKSREDAEFLASIKAGEFHTRMNTAFHALNFLGKQEAAKRVEELTEIPRYRAETTPQSAQMPRGDVETAPQPPAEVEEGKDTGPDQEAPETTENKESG